MAALQRRRRQIPGLEPFSVVLVLRAPRLPAQPGRDVGSVVAPNQYATRKHSERLPCAQVELEPGRCQQTAQKRAKSASKPMTVRLCIVATERPANDMRAFVAMRTNAVMLTHVMTPARRRSTRHSAPPHVGRSLRTLRTTSTLALPSTLTASHAARPGQSPRRCCTDWEPTVPLPHILLSIPTASRSAESNSPLCAGLAANTDN